MEDFDELLEPRSTPCSDGVRRNVLNSTVAEVRRTRQRRKRRRIGMAAAVLVCLLVFVGIRIGTIDLTSQRPPRTRGTSSAQISPGAPTGPAAVAPVDEETPAIVLERIGETSEPEQRAELYRRAGDRYLEETTDPASALRCYSQALDEGSAEDLNISVNDSWLLMALKMDRRKEKEDGRRD
jgi:hypothetical protein